MIESFLNWLIGPTLVQTSLVIGVIGAVLTGIAAIIKAATRND